MVERRIRCTSIPAGSCARENHEECKYCRMNDLIATRREGAEEGAELPPELLAAIQQDDYERSWRRNHATTTTAMQTVALQGETQTTQRCTCEDCLRGGCCVGFAGGGPCTFIGTCTTPCNHRPTVAPFAARRLALCLTQAPRRLLIGTNISGWRHHLCACPACRGDRQQRTPAPPRLGRRTRRG
jgi:hypothetical protein